ncbi:MAG: fused MFS/spermidine synthase [Patescibacteria group bacterium]
MNRRLPEDKTMLLYLFCIAFSVGGASMIIELVGLRILIPYYGNSINLWSIVISVILGSLSIGYWIGGVLSDKNKRLSILQNLLFSAGIILVVTTIFKDSIIYYVDLLSNNNLLLSSLYSSIILFAPTNIFLGMIFPYIINMNLSSLKKIGISVGSFYAISTIGSIVGTISSSFILIPRLGTDKILIIIGAYLISLSLFFIHLKTFLKRFVIFLLAISTIFLLNDLQKFYRKAGLTEFDSLYSKIYILDIYNSSLRQQGKYLITGAYGIQSAAFENTYSPYILVLKKILKPFFTKDTVALVIGGGPLVLSNQLSMINPKSTIDTVEVDPEMVKISSIFNKTFQNKQNVFIEDGRIFLEKTTTKYQMIINDVFIDLYPPFQLVTFEAFQKAYMLLDKNGLMVTNIISSLEGSNSILFKKIYVTYKAVFPYVYVVPINQHFSANLVQNILLIGTKSNQASNMMKQSLIDEGVPIIKTQKTMSKDKSILTDNYAPVEYDVLPITLKKSRYYISGQILSIKTLALQKYFINLFSQIKSLFL